MAAEEQSHETSPLYQEGQEVSSLMMAVRSRYPNIERLFSCGIPMDSMPLIGQTKVSEFIICLLVEQQLNADEQKKNTFKRYFVLDPDITEYAFQAEFGNKLETIPDGVILEYQIGIDGKPLIDEDNKAVFKQVGYINTKSCISNSADRKLKEAKIQGGKTATMHRKLMCQNHTGRHVLEDIFKEYILQYFFELPKRYMRLEYSAVGFHRSALLIKLQYLSNVPEGLKQNFLLLESNLYICYTDDFFKGKKTESFGLYD